MYEETIEGLRKIVQDHKGRLTPYMRLTICKAADAIEELQEDNAALNGTVSNLIGQIAELRKPGWIPVTERLPEERKAVIVWEPRYLNPYICVLSEGEWYVFGGYGVKVFGVTHWMPLPEPPKEET